MSAAGAASAGQRLRGLAARWLHRVPGVHPGSSSLHRHLLLWLLLPQLVLWAAAAFVTYNIAARYANAAIDASLSQATRSLSRQVKPIGNGLFIDFPRAAQDILEADPDDRISYMVSTPPGQFILGNKQLPLPDVTAPRIGATYLYDGLLDGVPVRVSALYVAYGEEDSKQLMLVQLARSSANRDELARSILQDTVLPLSGLIVLMTMIVWAGIRAGLAPLARLRTQVEDKAPNDLAPLELDAAPQELRSLAQALNTLLAEVHESVAAQRRFVSDAAHQLRTPLAGLKSQTEIALRDNRDPVLENRLKLVHESAVRSAHLVNQLLTLARAEPESAAALVQQPVDLRALAGEATAQLVPRARQAHIDLGFDDSGCPDAAPRVRGHALLLREALVNVIDNALRYATGQPSGEPPQVTVGVAREGEQAVVTVADNGPGIAPAQREAVFRRFVRGTHEGTGCGLGLAIVKEIVERHGGKVSLHAQTPRGLLVRIALPLAA